MWIECSAEIPPLTVKNHDAWCFGKQILHQCERCDMIGKEVKYCPSQTMYHWNGKGEDPNRDLLFCPDCAEDYNLHMDSLWAELNYHSY